MAEIESKQLDIAAIGDHLIAYLRYWDLHVLKHMPYISDGEEGIPTNGLGTGRYGSVTSTIHIEDKVELIQTYKTRLRVIENAIDHLGIINNLPTYIQNNLNNRPEYINKGIQDLNQKNKFFIFNPKIEYSGDPLNINDVHSRSKLKDRSHFKDVEWTKEANIFLRDNTQIPLTSYIFTHSFNLYLREIYELCLPQLRQDEVSSFITLMTSGNNTMFNELNHWIVYNHLKSQEEEKDFDIEQSFTEAFHGLKNLNAFRLKEEFHRHRVIDGEEKIVNYMLNTRCPFEQQSLKISTNKNQNPLVKIYRDILNNPKEYKRLEKSLMNKMFIDGDNFDEGISYYTKKVRRCLVYFASRLIQKP